MSLNFRHFLKDESARSLILINKIREIEKPSVSIYFRVTKNCNIVSSIIVKYLIVSIFYLQILSIKLFAYIQLLYYTQVTRLLQYRILKCLVLGHVLPVTKTIVHIYMVINYYFVLFFRNLLFLCVFIMKVGKLDGKGIIVFLLTA